MKIAEPPSPLKRVMDLSLSTINVKRMKNLRTMICSLLFIMAVGYILLGIYLISTSNYVISVPQTNNNNTYYSTETLTNQSQLVAGIAILISGPIVQILLGCIVEILISQTYDTKIIKHFLLYSKKYNDDDVVIYEELKPEKQFNYVSEQIQKIKNKMD